MAQRRPTVLIVEPDDETRLRIADALEAAGMRALMCPGPTGPDFSCVGVRRGACPLDSAADVVVLNMQLASDEIHRGTPGWGLLASYRTRGIPVVALVDPADPMRLFPEANLAVVPRQAGRRELLAAIRRLTGAEVSLQALAAEHRAPWRAQRTPHRAPPRRPRG